MKTSVALAIAFLTVLPSFGQYSARRLTRRIAPQTQPPPQQAPAQPAQAAPAPAPVQPGYQAPAVAAPSAPVDPQKVAAQKSKSERDLLAWQKKRAEEGSDNAQYELGMRYMTGNGVEQDEKQGREWIEKAAKNGNAKAVKKLEELNAAGGGEATPAAIAAPAATTPATPSK